jgi:hypothetical protein
LLPLGDNAFEVVFARQPEQPLAIPLNMVAVKQSLTPLRHNRTQPELALDQRQVPQVLPIQQQQVESVKAGLATPEQQDFELRFAMAVEGNNFAVEDRRPGTEFGR